jgi:hypothetical protein
MNTKRFIHGVAKGVVFGSVLYYAGLNVVEQPIATIVCMILLVAVSAPINYNEDSK